MLHPTSNCFEAWSKRSADSSAIRLRLFDGNGLILAHTMVISKALLPLEVKMEGSAPNERNVFSTSWLPPWAALCNAVYPSASRHSSMTRNPKGGAFIAFITGKSKVITGVVLQKIFWRACRLSKCQQVEFGRVKWLPTVDVNGCIKSFQDYVQPLATTLKVS